MAKVQIGAVIGVEGAKQYKAQLDACTAATKNLASQTKLIEASFEGATKSVYDLTRQKVALKGEIIGVGEKLATQRAELSQVVEAYKRGDENALKYKNQMYDLATQTNNTEAELYKLEQRLKELNEENGITLFVKGWEESTNKTGEALKKIGDGLTKYVTLPIVGGMVASVKTAADFETAFVGVTKTVDGTKEELASLKEELMQIPLVTASSTEDVMAVAQAAGQLNVPLERIADFTKTIIMLGDSTNISSEEGATSIARFMNIVGEDLSEGTENVDRFASSLVALGNNTATDESSILALAMRLASAGHLAGLTIPEILGLSAAMSSVGLTAEAGGTAMSTTMNLISKDVAEGGENLEKFAKVAGTTAEKFAKKWRENPVDALQDLLAGMAELSEDGGAELLEFMDEVGWAGIRQSDTMRRLASDVDGVSSAVDIANENFKTNSEVMDGSNALNDEASKKYETLDSKLSQFKESVRQLASAFGEEILPVLKPIIDDLTEMVKKFAGLDEQTKENILKFLGIVAVVGPVIGGIGNLMIWVDKLKGAFAALKGAKGVGGVIEAMAGTGGTGGGGLISTMGSLISKGDELYDNILNKLVPALEGSGMVSLGGALLGVGVAYGTTYAAATIMDQKMYESAEACEYVAKRYHWSEEKVNEFGYTWDSNGHLVELTNQKIYDTTSETSLDVMRELHQASLDAKKETEQGSQYVVDAVGNRIPDVQEKAHKMVYTAVEEAKGAASETYGYGTELGNNFANGISATINNVRSAVHGIARTVQSYLHFSEPDVGPLSNFNSWMPDMMHQMASGITDNMYLVENALSGLTGGMANQMGQSYNYGGVVINLNVPQGANGYQLVDQIEDALAQRTVRRRAVFG